MAEVLAHIAGKDNRGPRTEMTLSALLLSHPRYSLDFDYFLLLQMVSGMRADGWYITRSNSNFISSLIISQRRRDFCHQFLQIKSQKDSQLARKGF